MSAPETGDGSGRAIRHETAGGVVVNGAGRVLVLLRDVWRDGGVVHEIRLPKGHIDAGETPGQAAVREVREESGYQGLEIVADLGGSESRYAFRGCRHERLERYYLMRLTDPERGTPQPMGAEEALFEPAWLAPEDAALRLTYPSEREFVRRAMERMGDMSGDQASAGG